MSTDRSARGVATAPHSAAARGGTRPLAQVTIVIPTHNRADLLSQTLRSVEGQTRPAAAVIVCDDGSTEDIAAVARRAGASCIRNDAGGWGPAGARNAGLEQVRTPLVWFLDSDDLLLPDAVERLTAAMESGPEQPPFAFGRALIAEHAPEGWNPLDVIEARPSELEDLTTSIYVRNSVPTSATLARTEAVLAAGGFDVAAEYSEDHRLWVGLARTGAPAHVPELIAVYRSHEGGRHTPLRALDVDLENAELTGGDSRLERREAERRGVLLVESAGDALRSGQSARIPALLWKLVFAAPRKSRASRSAIRHYRERRRGPARARDEWHRSPSLRSWLASFH